MVRPAYRTAKGREYAELIWIDPKTGNRERESLGAVGHGPGQVSRTRVKHLAAKKQTEFANNPPMASARGDATVSEWCDEFAKIRAADGLGKRTLDSDRATLALLREHLGDHRLDKVTPADADRWRRTIAALPAIASRFTLRNHVTGARRVFGRAVELELIARNPFETQRVSARRVPHSPTTLTPEEFARVLNALPSPGWRALVGLCGYAGLRAGEASRLRWEDVRWEDRLIRITPPEMTETTKHRVRLPRLEPELAAVLRAAREACPADQGVVTTADASNATRTLFGWTDEKRGRVYTGACERAGVEPWSDPLQGLRRWRINQWARDGFPQHVVVSWLGNSDEVAQEFYFAVGQEYYSTESPLKLARREAMEAQAECERLRAELATLRRNRAATRKSRPPKTP
jgi:integrase